MSVQLIGIILTILFFVLIALGTISGIIRGASKSTFRLIWTLVITVVLFFVCGYITKALFDLQLSFLPVPDGYEHTLHGLIQSYIESDPQIADICNSSIAMKELVNNAPYLILNVIIFEVLFWLAKWLLWPVWAILAKIFIKKNKVTINNGTRATIDKKKHRVIGAFVGAFMGICTAIVTVMPVVGLSSVLIKLEDTKTEDGKGLITYIAGDKASQIVPYIYVYEDSALKPILKYTYLESFDNIMFDSLTTLQVNDSTISLNDLVDTASDVYADAMYLLDVDFTNLTREDVQNILPHLRNIVNKVLDNNTLSEIALGVSHYAMNEYINSESFSTMLAEKGWEKYRSEIQEIVNTFDPNDAHIDEIKGDLEGIIDSIEVLNDNDVLIPLIRGEINSINSFVSSLSDDFTADISTALAKIGTMKRAVPIMFDVAIQTLCDNMGIQFDGEANMSINNYETFVTNIVGSVMDLLSEFDTNDNLEINGGTLEIFGSMIDSIKDCGMLSSENFTKLIDGFEGYAIDLLGEQTDQNVVNIISPIIKNISTTTSYKNDLAIIGRVIDEVSDAYKNNEFNDYKSLNLQKMGTWLDELYQTSVFKNSIDEVIDKTQDYIASLEIDEYIKKGAEKLVPYIKQVKEFEAELTKLAPVYQKTIDLINADNASKKDVIKALAISIDNAISEGSQIITKKHIVDVAKTALQYIEMDANLKDIVSDAVSIIDSSETISFAKEIEFALSIYDDVKVLIDSKDYTNEETVTSIATKVDNAISQGSVIITKANIVDLATKFLDTMDLDQTIKDMANDVILAIRDSDSNFKFANEVKNILPIYNDVQSLIDLGDYTDETLLTQLGRHLDSAITNQSIIIDLDTISELAQSLFDSVTDIDLQDALAKIENNIKNVTSFEKEITLILPIFKEYENITQDGGTISIDNVQTIAEKIDNAIANSSALLTNDVVVSVFSNVVNDMTLPEDIANVMVGGVSIKTAIKNNLPNVTSWADEVAIINNITSAPTTNYAEYGALIDIMKTSKIFNNLIVPIIDDILSKADIDPSIKQYINITDNMVDQSGNLIDYVYADKFAILDEVLALDFNTVTMTDLGDIADKLSLNELFGIEFVNGVLKENMSVDLGDYNDLVESIKANIDNITEQNSTNNIYTIELQYIDTVIKACDEANTSYTIDGLFDTSSGYAIVDNTGSSKSVLVDNTVIHNMLNRVVDEVQTSLNDAAYNAIFATMKQNIAESNDFAAIVDELNYLKDNLQTVVDNTEIDTIGTQLDDLVANCQIVLGDDGVKDVAITAITEMKNSETQEPVKAVLQEIIDEITAITNPSYAQIIEEKLQSINQ